MIENNDCERNKTEKKLQVANQLSRYFADQKTFHTFIFYNKFLNTCPIRLSLVTMQLILA